MRQLAAKADVPPSTMNRLARALDFDTYDEFRALYRDSINEQSAGYSLEGGQVRAVARESEFDHALNAFQQAAVNNINTLFDHIDRAALERAVQALTAARNVLVVGMHTSHASADHLHRVAAMGFNNWHLLARDNADALSSGGGFGACRCCRLYRRRALRGRFHQGCPARPGGRRTSHRDHRSSDVSAGRLLGRHPAYFGAQPEPIFHPTLALRP